MIGWLKSMLFLNAHINSFRRNLTVWCCLSRKLFDNAFQFLLFSMRSLFFDLLYSTSKFLQNIVKLRGVIRTQLKTNDGAFLKTPS